jgi:Nucleoside-diphosphate-sugar epimerases
MNVIVFGSCGFIGSALVHYYKSNSSRVLAIDIIEKSEEFYYCFKREDKEFNQLISDWKPDVLINAAGAANVSLSLKQPEWDFASNVNAVFELLNNIRIACPDCKVIQLSSAAVYGNPIIIPVSENEDVKPLSPYGFHKYQSEIVCREFTEIFGLKIAILRIFSAFGNGLKKQLFWDLYEKTKASNSLNLSGTGNESRDFIFIDDLVGVIDLVIQKGNFNCEIYNVANGEEVFIKDAVELFTKNINWKGKIEFDGSSRKGDPVNWKADISKIKKLGYEPVVSFSRGIEKYTTWLRDCGLL